MLIRRHTGSIIRDADLVAAAEAVLGEKLDWFVADWIEASAPPT